MQKALATTFSSLKKEKVVKPEGRNILRSISREYIFEIGKQLGFEVIEKSIEPYDIYDAHEALMAGTPFCILPTTSLNGIDIGTGRMGPVTNALLE